MTEPGHAATFGIDLIIMVSAGGVEFGVISQRTRWWRTRCRSTRAEVWNSRSSFPAQNRNQRPMIAVTLPNGVYRISEKVPATRDTNLQLAVNGGTR